MLLAAESNSTFNFFFFALDDVLLHNTFESFKKMLEQKGVVIPTELLHNFFHFVLFV